MKTIKYIFILFISIMLPFSIYSYNESKLLNGIKIVLDAGHGGFDTGASYQNIYESDINLIITKKLEKRLKQLGCNVIMTRKNHEDLSNSNKKREDMKKRIQIINDERNDMLISIHLNAYSNDQVHGLHVFHQNNQNSIKLANIIQNQANQQLNQNKDIKQGNFYLLNNSRILGVLIECGFLSNEIDRNQLINENYQNKIIDCIIDAIKIYYENIL